MFSRTKTTYGKIKSCFFRAAIVFVLVIFAFSFAPAFASGVPVRQDNRYVVKLSNPDSLSKLSRVSSNIEKFFSQNASPEFSGLYSFDSGFSEAFLKQYLSGYYAYLEANKPIVAAEALTNDPGFTNNAADIDKQWGLAKVGFDKAWDKTAGSKSNIVAVIDTGIDATHEDLQKINFVMGFDFINKQPINGNVNTDDNGHGTLVAGVLGATQNNGIGIAGVNWLISIMPLKALDSTGKGDSATISEAIVWAADHGANFINLSIGGVGFGHDTTLANAISYAFNKGAVIVAAAGNDMALNGISLDSEPVYPICDDNNVNMVIGVAATDQNDLKPAFSNYGKNCIDVTAPGKRILSTINYDPLTKKSAPNSYAYASGTSLAVPFVVGQATLIKALYPIATNIQIRDRIISTTDSTDNLNLTQCGGLNCRGLLGTGRINVKKSLETKIEVGIQEGDIVQLENTSAIYKIFGGQKRMISPFVFNQQFSGAYVKSVLPSQLVNFPEGPYLTPLDGTLVKIDSSPTVYQISKGQKLPITAQVFQQRGYSFSRVNTLSYSEIASWATSNFLPPKEGTLVKSDKNKTVYWVVDEKLHPINFAFYKQRGLDIFQIMTVPDKDLAGYFKGEAFIY